MSSAFSSNRPVIALGLPPYPETTEYICTNCACSQNPPPFDTSLLATYRHGDCLKFLEVTCAMGKYSVT